VSVCVCVCARERERTSSLGRQEGVAVLDQLHRRDRPPVLRVRVRVRIRVRVRVRVRVRIRVRVRVRVGVGVKVSCIDGIVHPFCTKTLCYEPGTLVETPEARDTVRGGFGVGV